MYGSARLVHDTQCLRPCERTEYTLKQTTFFSPHSNGTLYTTVMLGKQEGETAIFREEVLEYTFTDLISDVGGMMGLFLGMSLWGLANDLKNLLERIFK